MTDHVVVNMRVKHVVVNMQYSMRYIADWGREALTTDSLAIDWNAIGANKCESPGGVVVASSYIYHHTVYTIHTCLSHRLCVYLTHIFAYKTSKEVDLKFRHLIFLAFDWITM